MKIFFRIKEQSNEVQEEEFLKLSPSERVLVFFELVYFFNQFPTKTPKNKSNNFIIERKR